MEAPKKKCKTVAWTELRSDLVAHLVGHDYECIAKYLVPIVKQFAIPSWVLEPTYKMSCVQCKKEACFIDLEDALKHDWVPGHCPDHLPTYLGDQTPWDYIDDHWEISWDRFHCVECGATAMYENTNDAADHGWWVDWCYWCPDHCHEGWLHTNGRELHCCECNTIALYEDLDEAYFHGWWINNDLEYCSEHATEAIRKHDAGL